MLLRINPQNPQLRLIKQVAATLNDGGVIAYPTDTVYGFGCSLYNKKGIERIYLIKRSEKNRPFSFICADLKDISLYTKVSNYAYKTMKRFLPGPYTFILEGTKLVPKIMLTKRSTAQLPGGEVFYDPGEIERKVGHALDAVIDGGMLVSEPSSVIDLTEDQPKVLRAGKGDVSSFL
jgi:tRNA A37 threonylcarbamoyladenosine synthetase subunit TsaC/SUA5/YrdC